MNVQQILADIDAKKWKSIYFLAGDEPYFIDKIVSSLEAQVLTEEEKNFNQSILYGSETDMTAVLAEARRYPMMAERVLVIVKEAQHLRKWEMLASYAENPQASTILVFAHKHKKIDKRKKVFKLLQQKHLLLETKRLYDNQVPQWVQQSLERRGYRISPKASHLIAESLGTDLARVENELDKLSLILPQGTEVTDELVEQNIGISKDFNNFELLKALAYRDFQRVIRIQNYFASSPKDHPLVLTITVLYGFVSKLLIAHQARDKSPKGLASSLKVNPFFVKDYSHAMQHYDLRKCARMLGYLREADMKSKGVHNASTPDSELLKELLFKMFYV